MKTPALKQSKKLQSSYRISLSLSLCKFKFSLVPVENVIDIFSRNNNSTALCTGHIIFWFPSAFVKIVFFFLLYDFQNIPTVFELPVIF